MNNIPQKACVYIGLGSNQGDSFSHLKKAYLALTDLASGEEIQCSQIYLTEPWGNTQQPAFMNAVVKFYTTLTPEALLTTLQALEIHLGRDRSKPEKWGPRVIDLDILLYDQQIIKTPHLIIPHPYLTQRDFVLFPLAELSPNLQLPDGTSLHDWIEKLNQPCPPVLMQKPLQAFVPLNK